MVGIQGYLWNLSQLYSYDSWFQVDFNLLYRLCSRCCYPFVDDGVPFLVPSQKSGRLESIWLCILMKYITNASKPCPISYYYITFEKLTSQFTIILPIHCCLLYRVCFPVETSFFIYIMFSHPSVILLCKGTAAGFGLQPMKRNLNSQPPSLCLVSHALISSSLPYGPSSRVGRLYFF